MINLNILILIILLVILSANNLSINWFLWGNFRWIIFKLIFTSDAFTCFAYFILFLIVKDSFSLFYAFNLNIMISYNIGSQILRLNNNLFLLKCLIRLSNWIIKIFKFYLEIRILISDCIFKWNHLWIWFTLFVFFWIL